METPHFNVIVISEHPRAKPPYHSCQSLGTSHSHVMVVRRSVWAVCTCLFSVFCVIVARPPFRVHIICQKAYKDPLSPSHTLGKEGSATTRSISRFQVLARE
jgi:hypothetical protein